MKACSVCGSLGMDTDAKCGVCGNSLLDVRAGEVQGDRAAAKPTSKPDRRKLRRFYVVLTASLFLSGLIVIIFLEEFSLFGILLVIISLVLVMLMFSSGPTTKYSGRYGWFRRKLEDEIEEERAKERSD